MRELNLSDTGLTSTTQKEIADGIMRAKQLEIIRVRDNNASPAMNMAALIYNLAFSPKIRLIDVTNTASAGNAATVESC